MEEENALLQVDHNDVEEAQQSEHSTTVELLDHTQVTPPLQGEAEEQVLVEEPEAEQDQEGEQGEVSTVVVMDDVEEASDDAAEGAEGLEEEEEQQQQMDVEDEEPPVTGTEAPEGDAPVEAAVVEEVSDGNHDDSATAVAADDEADVVVDASLPLDEEGEREQGSMGPQVEPELTEPAAAEEEGEQQQEVVTHPTGELVETLEEVEEDANANIEAIPDEQQVEEVGVSEVSFTEAGEESQPSSATAVAAAAAAAPPFTESALKPQESSVKANAAVSPTSEASSSSPQKQQRSNETSPRRTQSRLASVTISHERSTRHPAELLDENPVNHALFDYASAASVAAMSGSAVAGGEVLAEFRRGNDNSHVNRMASGSYSRYLLSTDAMPDEVLVGSFYGSEPTLGAVPSNMDYRRLRAQEYERQQQQSMGNNLSARSRSGDSQRHRGTSPGNQTPLRMLSSRKQQQMLQMSLPSGTRRTASELGTWGRTNNSTYAELNRNQRIVGGNVSSTVPREEDLLDPMTYHELNAQRERRRHHFSHCKPVREQRDFVYYNHKSKGYFVPHDPPQDTRMLNYNHLFGFTDGTRFENGMRPARRNPTAQAPMYYGETTRGAAAMNGVGNTTAVLAASKRKNEETPDCTSKHFKASRSHKNREDIARGSCSLSTAKAVDVNQLHCSQFRRTRTIEDVMANDSAAYVTPEVASGLKGAVDVGKFNWGEMPANMRAAIAETTVNAQASAATTPKKPEAPTSSASHQPRMYHRQPQQKQPQPMSFTDRPGRGLLDVVGAVHSARGEGNQASMYTSASASVSPIHGRGGSAADGSGNNQMNVASCVLPAVDRRPHAVSRLHFTKRHDPDVTPSAYVNLGR